MIDSKKVVKNMDEENLSQEFRLKNIKEIKNYFIKETNQNELMKNKHKKVYRILTYIDHFLVSASSITGCVSVSAFASLVVIPIGITSFMVGLKFVQ